MVNPCTETVVVKFADKVVEVVIGSNLHCLVQLLLFKHLKTKYRTQRKINDCLKAERQ